MYLTISYTKLPITRSFSHYVRSRAASPQKGTPLLADNTQNSVLCAILVYAELNRLQAGWSFASHDFPRTGSVGVLRQRNWSATSADLPSNRGTMKPKTSPSTHPGQGPTTKITKRSSCSRHGHHPVSVPGTLKTRDNPRVVPTATEQRSTHASTLRNRVCHPDHANHRHHDPAVTAHRRAGRRTVSLFHLHPTTSTVCKEGVQGARPQKRAGVLGGKGVSFPPSQVSGPGRP